MSKFVYAQPEVQFAGFVLSADGYRIDPAITEAIKRFPTPTNHTDLRSFFGLANQLSASTNTVAPVLAPLCTLLSTKNDFVWSPAHDLEFGSAKDSLISSPVLSFFNVKKPTRLCTDASRQGLGFVLQQKQGEAWSLVQAGYRFLSDTVSRYAVIELELLAITWVIQKYQIFLAGMPHFQIITDQHPLISILNTQCLNEIKNPRLQHLKAHIMAYNFTVESGPRCFVKKPCVWPSSPRIWKCAIDFQHIAVNCQNHVCRCYWSIRQHLSIDDNLIVCGCRLLIPAAMRREVFQKLHESHQGSVRTKQRAQLVVYWPGIDNDNENVVLLCKKCQDLLPANCKEPIKTCQTLPGSRRQFLLLRRKELLYLVDCFSDWPDIIPMGRDTTTAKLISAMRQSFCRTCIADVFWSDQGSQFMSKQFQEFAKHWGFRHATSTPRYPQSNGKNEGKV